MSALRVRIDMTAPAPTFVYDPEGHYLVQYAGPVGSASRESDARYALLAIYDAAEGRPDIRALVTAGLATPKEEQG